MFPHKENYGSTDWKFSKESIALEPSIGPVGAKLQFDDI